MKYKVVIFDLFGTLIDKLSLRKHRDVLGQMASVLSIPSDEFIKLWFDTFDMRGLGTFQSLESNVEYICRKLEVYAKDDKITQAAKINREYTVRSMKPRPYATELLSYLKSRGYKAGLITNCGTEIPRILNDMPFVSLIDVAVFSCLEGVQKPAPRIYELAVERLVVKTEECMYIADGMEQELLGASKLGMRAVLIRVPGENDYDPYREEWGGPVISSLKEVLTLVND